MKRLNTPERLKRRTDFRAAATGARAAGKTFILQARDRGPEQGQAGNPRIGFTVSRQVGNAVERNRVRRRLREIVRLSGGGDLRAGYDYVLIGRRAALQAPFDAMMGDFAAALRRVHAGGDARRGGRTGAADTNPLHKAGSPGRPGPRQRPNFAKPDEIRPQPPQQD